MAKGRFRKAVPALFAALLLLSILSLVGKVPAQGSIQVLLRDSLSFEPGSFTVTAGESISLTLINAGALTHTFTLFAQPNANVPVNDFSALQNYYNANSKLVDRILAGGEQDATSFTAPMTVGTYTFVCMIPGHAAGGMHGFMVVTSPTPPIVTPSAPRGLLATAGDSQVTLDWNHPLEDGGSQVTGFRVYRGTAAGSLSFLVQTSNVSGHTDAGLTNGVTYYYEVSAINAMGEGQRSNEASATPMGLENAFQSLQTVLIIAAVVVGAAAAVAALLLWRRKGKYSSLHAGSGGP